MANETAPSLSSPEQLHAFLEIILLVAYADGVFSDPEHLTVIQQVEQLCGAQFSELEIETSLQAIAPTLPQDATQTRKRLRAAGEQLAQAELKRAAFQAALRVAHADSGLSVQEGSLLAHMGAELGFRPDEALELLREAQLSSFTHTPQS